MNLLPAERPGEVPPPELAAQRAQLEAAIGAGMWRVVPLPEEVALGQCRALRITPLYPVNGYVLHFHGGGYRLGAPELAAPFAAMLAARCGVEVLLPRYRLAPEHPFPAGLNDAQASLRALRARIGAAPLIVSGDSAGGGLAAALGVLAQQDAALRMDGLVLLSPWLDLTVSAPSYSANAAHDPLFSAESASKAAALYLQGVPAAHPLASPALAMIERYPPVFINIGSGEVLLDEVVRFHTKLVTLGGRAALEVVEGMEHTAVVRNMQLTGAAASFERVMAFIAQVLAAKP